MLRRFMYLDRPDLNQYMTALEGGRTTGSTKRLTRTGTGSAGLEVKVLSASGEKSREEEESRTLADTDEAQFDRLLRAAASDPEDLGWVEVAEPETDFEGIGIGAMLSWECDLYIPEFVQTLARSGEALGAIEQMQNLLPMARSLGLDTEGLPNDEEMGAMSGFISGMDARLLVVGEDDATGWRVAGQLDADTHLCPNRRPPPDTSPPYRPRTRRCPPRPHLRRLTPVRHPCAQLTGRCLLGKRL